MRRNASRQLPAAPSAARDVRRRMRRLGHAPPWSRQSSTARSIEASSGWSADSKPSTSTPPAVVDAGVEQRLDRVEQPAVGRVQPGLRDRARRGDARASKSAKRDGRRGPPARPVLQAHPRLGDHAERALGAEEQPVGRRPGAGAGQPPRLADAGGVTTRIDSTKSSMWV